MPLEKRLKICFISGAAHSGSTLLGLILGSHSSTFFMGEANKVSFFTDPNFDPKRKYCRLCGKECNIWSKVDPEKDNIYEQLHNITKKSILIDSTKNVDWINRQLEILKNTKIEAQLIFLKRDLRAVINSMARKYPNRTLDRLINDWIIQITKTKTLYNLFQGKKIKIFYEDLSLNPDQNIEDLCNFLEITYEPEMKEYYNKDQHSIGGNIGTHYLLIKAKNSNDDWLLTERNEYYYRDHPFSIQLDERWKSELNSQDQEIILLKTGSLFNEFSWN